MVEALNVLIELVFARFVSTLQNVALSLIWVEMMRPWGAKTSKLLYNIWVIIRVRHAVVVG